MFQAPLPPVYSQMAEEEAQQRIADAKMKLGSDLVILGHHYQREEIIVHSDYRGDSFKLCKDAANHPDAKYIVFCGVHFMAESADILTSDSQKVILPNLAAGCSMADMANIEQVHSCWTQLPEGVLPITYINSAADLKAFVGEHDGSVCTSSNATAVMKWALGRSEKLIFLPDQHLGRNTAFKLGFDPDEDMVLWDPMLPFGGNTEDKLRQAKIILWKGHCSVHCRFNVNQIEAARKVYPGIKIIVHPECPLDVVKKADLDGSTEFIIKTIRASEPGAKWGIGTEINLVKRLANENSDKFIMCLDPVVCPCETMYRIHPSYLCWALENLVEGNIVNQITVPEEIASQARIALERMLSIT
ncbi:MAG: quinolinate synthase NadA [bacterium]